MHTNLISRLIYATFPVPGGEGEGGIGWREKNVTKNVQSMILG